MKDDEILKEVLKGYNIGKEYTISELRIRNLVKKAITLTRQECEKENICFQCEKSLKITDYKQCDSCVLKMVKDAEQAERKRILELIDKEFENVDNGIQNDDITEEEALKYLFDWRDKALKKEVGK